MPRKKTSTFMADLAAGHEAERKVQEYLNRKHGPEHHFMQAVGENSKFDLWCLMCSEKVEVKRDLKAQTTGNLCLERDLFAKTHSQTIAYVIGEEIHLFRLEELVRALKQLTVEGKTTKMMLGDRNANSAVLVKLEEILPYGTKVKELQHV